jgi:polysaccharide export outer membrane protein
MTVLLLRDHRISGVLLQVAGIASALFILAAAGCAQQTIWANKLPTEFQAPPTKNISEINLSRLGNYSVDSQLIDCGDVLEVTIVTDITGPTNPSSTTPVRVAEDGTASVPLIGQVPLAGLDLEGAEQAIASAGVAQGIFQRPPHVTVTMKQQRTNDVTVIGAVKNEGVYKLPRNASSLLNALVTAGGLSEDAGEYVEIHPPQGRGGVPQWMQPSPQHVADGTAAQLAAYEGPCPANATTGRAVRVNLASAAAEQEGGRHLEDGDVVMVSKRDPKPIYVIGLVKQPGEIELPPSKDMYLLDALAKAGDRTMQAANKVFIVRRVPGRKEPVVIQSDVQLAKRNGEYNVRLAPGDIVSVEETPTTLVLDTLKSFLRFGFSSSIPLIP